MRCPRCKRLKDILAWVPMQQIEEFVDETHPIYKCSDCHWIFAPAVHVLDDLRSFGEF